MGRSQETFGKKEVRDKKAKKKREKEAKRQAKREQGKKSLDDMIAYVDEHGNFTSTPPDPAEREEVDLESIQIDVSRQEDVEEDPIRTGTVTFFNHDKGYGFIKDANSRESYFVHINNVEGGVLNENNRVKFEIEPGLKGPTAVRVSLDK
ncbi:MAG: cold shock domain-containing protein [Bacteroidia bacterium]|nr:cold shock domain-containing protein [Bacteroidia bacterium]